MPPLGVTAVGERGGLLIGSPPSSKIYLNTRVGSGFLGLGCLLRVFSLLARFRLGFFRFYVVRFRLAVLGFEGFNGVFYGFRS